jgi:hypothetical protein
MKKFSTDKEKLEQILKFSMLDKAKLGRKIGVENQELYQIANGKQSEFSRGTMVKLVKIFPEISPYWLITGEGSMLSGSIEHHNAVATDHSKAVVNHTENTNRDEVLKSQQQTIDRLSRIIEQLTIK